MPQSDIYNYIKGRKTYVSVNQIKKKFDSSSSSVNRCLHRLLQFKEIKRQRVKKGHFYFFEYKVV